MLDVAYVGIAQLKTSIYLLGMPKPTRHTLNPRFWQPMKVPTSVNT